MDLLSVVDAGSGAYATNAAVYGAPPGFRGVLAAMWRLPGTLLGPEATGPRAHPGMGWVPASCHVVARWGGGVVGGSGCRPAWWWGVVFGELDSGCEHPAWLVACLHVVVFGSCGVGVWLVALFVM
jgi:hypothetical protein